MLSECIEALNIRPEGIYIDVTYGAGGHSKEIMKNVSGEGHLYGFDQDGDVDEHVMNNEHFTFVKSNFRHIARFMKYYGVEGVDGVLADLGVSSHQLDFPERGFSYRYDAELDMRMNEDGKVTARDVVAGYSQDELQDIFSRYGEVRNARSLAREIVKRRKVAVVNTTYDLNLILEDMMMGQKPKYFAQVYQALRMEVNEEVDVLREMLEGVYRVLRPGGRLVVMSYHSIEDRMVKNFLKTGSVEGEVQKDDFGNIYRPFKIKNKKIITATAEELARNSRAKSAKLRVAEKK